MAKAKAKAVKAPSKKAKKKRAIAPPTLARNRRS